MINDTTIPYSGQKKSTLSLTAMVDEILLLKKHMCDLKSRVNEICSFLSKLEGKQDD